MDDEVEEEMVDDYRETKDMEELEEQEGGERGSGG